MPFIVQKTDQCPISKPIGVFTEVGGHGTGKTGRLHGCFSSKAAAREQQKALYENVPEAKSDAPPPPNLRDADEDSGECCLSCRMFAGYNDEDGFGFCWGYGNKQVKPTQVCDSWAEEVDETDEAKSSTGRREVPMTATASPALLPHTIERRKERAYKLSESQRRRAETRQVHEPLELREGATEGTRTLRSYASLFNEPYVIRSLGHRFEETIKPGAFKRTLNTNPDVVFRTEHTDPPLAATWSGDLRLGEDAKGLWYEVDLDESDPDVRSLISKVERGVYRESSFGFRIGHKGDHWNDEHDKREILSCELDRGDVSVVTFGASRATGKHMLLRSEEALRELQEIGFEQFLEAWIEWRDFTTLPAEERLGKVISSQSMETLRKVLGLIADADDSVDEAEAMLSDFIGVPNPDEEKDDVTSSEQLDHVGRSEERDDPTYEDYDVMYGLKNAKLALASVKACQLCDPDYESDPDDQAVMTQIEAAEAAIDQALVAQSKDGRRDPDEANAEVKDLQERCEKLASDVGLEIRWLTDEDGKSGFEVRETLSTEDRKARARNALARASSKPEEGSVKGASHKGYPPPKPNGDRSEGIALLLPNDSEDLAFDLRLRSRR